MFLQFWPPKPIRTLWILYEMRTAVSAHSFQRLKRHMMRLFLGWTIEFTNLVIRTSILLLLSFDTIIYSDKIYHHSLRSTEHTSSKKKENHKYKFFAPKMLLKQSYASFCSKTLFALTLIHNFVVVNWTIAVDFIVQSSGSQLLLLLLPRGITVGADRGSRLLIHILANLIIFYCILKISTPTSLKCFNFWIWILPTLISKLFN